MSETTGKIHAAMVAVMRAATAIGKEKRNQQQGFNFRGIDDCYNALHSIMADAGIFTTTEVLEDRTEERETKNKSQLIYRVLKIRFGFHADDGSAVFSTMIGEGMDSGDKATNKAMAIAHKYALLQAWCVPTEDMPDPDAQAHEPSKPTAPKPLAKAKPPAARIEDAPPPATTDAGTLQTAEGAVLDVQSRDGVTNGKPWTKYGIHIGALWFGTFSKTNAEVAQSCQTDGIPARLTYRATERGNDLVSIERVDPIPEPVADDEPLPIDDPPPVAPVDAEREHAANLALCRLAQKERTSTYKRCCRVVGITELNAATPEKVAELVESLKAMEA